MEKRQRGFFFLGGKRNTCLSSPLERDSGFSTEADQKDTLLLILDERPGAAGRAGALCVGDDEDQVRLGELLGMVNPAGAKHGEG